MEHKRVPSGVNKQEEFESNPNWLILDSNDTGLNFSMRSESLLLLSTVKKAGRLDLDFHRFEMPFRVDASDYQVSFNFYTLLLDKVLFHLPPLPTDVHPFASKAAKNEAEESGLDVLPRKPRVAEDASKESLGHRFINHL